MRKIVCDKCGREDLAPIRPERYAVEIKLPATPPIKVDLCDPCMKRLRRWCADSDPVQAVA